MWGGGVQAEGSFSKRYLKYLAKKFLKNIQENEDEADVE